MGGRTLHRDRKGTKILYIEDNPENRMLARAILEAEGYTVVDAEDGLAGIEAAVSEVPALILLDVNLPGVDGYEVVAILKSFPSLATTPVIAVTAYAMEGDRQRTLVAGCDGYIQKPIDVDTFPHQIAEFLEGRRDRVEEREEGIYLRELNQRLVYRLVSQVEELKRINEHFVGRARQLEELHRAVQDLTSELGVTALLERFLPSLARALGSASLAVELSEPAGVRVAVQADGSGQPRSVLARSGLESSDDWVEVEWRLPLAVPGRTLGVMIARHVLPPAAKADEEQLLKIVANQVAIAVENARLYEETKQRLGETETLLTVSHAVSSTLELTETMRRVARETARALGCNMVGAYLADADQLNLRAIAGYHVPKQLLETLRAFPIPLKGHRFLEEAWGERRPNFSSDAEADLRIDRETFKRLPHRSVLFVPMIVRGEPIGGLFVVWWTQQHDFTSEELRLVEGISRQAGLAIENARLYEGVQRQMAELKQTQAQLIQSAKLAAIGELAANVAHEINNPLTSVLGFASYLAEQIQPGAPMREELDLILEEATRARDIVHDLLNFSRQREFEPEVTDINAILEQTVAMVRRQGRLEEITVNELYGANLPMAEVDVSRMKQVFVNIINNAVYAMKDGGTLTLRTGFSDGMVHTEFTDTGTGIAPEHVDKIFDPFFTTKPAVTGTGLGLSVSLGIVQSHGGTIEVRSQVGQGSTFTVKLPPKANVQPVVAAGGSHSLPPA
ncbi:MAG: response regulator [Candidatus Rokubacteria bacterium]|nr:response regulator [Candidatus Rokubacteria bacterium]